MAPGGGGSDRPTAATSPRGNTFDGLGPGTYRIGVSPRRALHRHLLSVRRPRGEDDDIVVQHGQAVTDADIALLREGAIEGTTSPTSWVHPSPGSRSSDQRHEDALLRRRHRRRRPLPHRPADHSRLRGALQRLRGGQESEFYVDAPTLFTATPVRVTSGRPTTGIDAQVSDMSVLRGTVTDVETGDPIPYARVDLYEEQDEYWQGLSTSVHADRRGRYEFAGVWAPTACSPSTAATRPTDTRSTRRRRPSRRGKPSSSPPAPTSPQTSAFR